MNGIHVPEHVVHNIVASIASDQANAECRRQEELTKVNQRLSTVKTRIKKIYEDKLDGKIDEQFCSERMAECEPNP